jgi:hypothetical protein
MKMGIEMAKRSFRFLDGIMQEEVMAHRCPDRGRFFGREELEFQQAGVMQNTSTFG